MTASVAGIGATRLRVAIPRWGAWWVEAQLEEESALSGRVDIVASDLLLSGTIVSGGVSGAGRSAYRIVGGAGGWGRVLPPKSYADAGGVKLSTVLQEAATEAGETLAGDIPDTRVGFAWPRDEGTADRVLQLLAPRAWYVDELGRTRLGRRPTVALAADLEHGPIDLARRTVSLSGEAIATVIPGIVVDGLEAADVEHVITRDGVRSHIWGATQAGELGQVEAALETAVLRLFPWLRYARGPFEFRVVTQTAELLDLQPVLSSLGFDDIEGVPVWGGVPGMRTDVELGSRVLVSFINADPSRPVVVGFEGALEGDETGRLIREGDHVMMPSGSAATPTAVPLALSAPGATVAPVPLTEPGPPGTGYAWTEA